MQIPNAFQRSYQDFETYPRNICNHNAYPGVLQAYANRLDGAASRLLTESEAEVAVPFRDLFPAGQGIAESISLSQEVLNLNRPSDPQYIWR